MKNRILRSPADLNPADIHDLYANFDAPISGLDCGQMCAPHNPTGKPFCCDICVAVPAAHTSEWKALEPATNLWHPWRGDECAADQPPAAEQTQLKASLPDGMILLACLGPQACQRPYRLLSCRQFPFFPYVSSDYRFLGLSYYWEFENTCWVISNLAQVSDTYRQQFIQTYDRLFALFQDEFDNYAARSEEMREHFAARRCRIPLLHRNSGFHLVSPASERMQRVDPSKLPQFQPYR
jgi:hypothetical protein